VQLYTGTLSSADEINVFEGSNTLALESSSGVWEIIQFKNAELLSEGKYKLSWLLRGQLGTEAAMRDPVPAGQRVVILGSSLRQLPLTLSELGREYYLRYGPAGIPFTDDKYTTTTKTFQGVGLRPYSPVHVDWNYDGADYTISWVRRDRSLAADSWELASIPMSEDTESYEVDVLNGAGAVVRTLSATDTQVVYTSTQRTSDGITAPFNVDVYQLSAMFGRGTGRRASIG
jgi:hypothetical protein